MQEVSSKNSVSRKHQCANDLIQLYEIPHVKTHMLQYNHAGLLAYAFLLSQQAYFDWKQSETFLKIWVHLFALFQANSELSKITICHTVILTYWSRLVPLLKLWEGANRSCFGWFWARGRRCRATFVCSAAHYFQSTATAAPRAARCWGQTSMKSCRPWV